MMIKVYRLMAHTFSQGATTATPWHCALCGATISGMGGPRYDCVCVQCGDAITEGKFARGELTCTIEESKT